MNVAMKLKIERMEKDIEELKQTVATLQESVAYLQGEHVGRKLDNVSAAAAVDALSRASRETLKLPEKRKSA